MVAVANTEANRSLAVAGTRLDVFKATSDRGLGPLVRISKRRFERTVAREDQEIMVALVDATAVDLNMGCRKLLKRLRRGDADALAAVERRAQAWDIDTDKLKQILDMILEFIAALMAMFSAFGL